MHQPAGRRLVRPGVAALVALTLSSSVLLASCSSTTAGPVRGRMVFSGGPAVLSHAGALPLSLYHFIQLPDVHAMPGTVVFTGSAGRFVEATDEQGWFDVTLPVGSYRVVGHSSLFQDRRVACTGAQVIGVTARDTVRVTEQGPTHVAVTCNGY